MQLTLDQVKNYLAKKGPNDYIGSPCSTGSCLAAETLKELYPGSEPMVWFNNSWSGLYMETEKEIVVEFTDEVRIVATRFDAMPDKHMLPVTRRELEKYMPELFQPEGETNA